MTNEINITVSQSLIHTQIRRKFLHILKKELESCAHNWIIIVTIHIQEIFLSFLKFKELGAVK